KAPAPEDEAASPQSPPTDHPEALPSPETLKERDPTEQNRPADGGSLLSALARLESAGTVLENAPARSTENEIHPLLPEYQFADIVPLAPASTADDRAPSNRASDPVDRFNSIEPIDPAAPVDSIAPVDVPKPSGPEGGSPNAPIVDPAGEGRRQIPMVRPPVRDEVPGRLASRRSRQRLMATGLVVTVVVAVAGWHLTGGSDACYAVGQGYDGSATRLAADTLAHRIVIAESGGDATAKNKRSSATGAGQFLDGTWLDMIRAHRPDLSGRSEAEILSLRHDLNLSREMVSRFAEGNADMLQSRCLPVTAGTLYLSHFAGGAGAVAVLSAPGHADAATTMAAADSRGRTTREMIVAANPFLRDFSVTDLKKWAERKMRGTGSI
ncbi:MAG: hypothetical protein GY798_23275, partial [Hyphomicrobiales bacterium]|nr:hypothetical protein [Hyphomicrobiales bacterium]